MDQTTKDVCLLMNEGLSRQRAERLKGERTEQGTRLTHNEIVTGSEMRVGENRKQGGIHGWGGLHDIGNQPAPSPVQQSISDYHSVGENRERGRGGRSRATAQPTWQLTSALSSQDWIMMTPLEFGTALWYAVLVHHGWLTTPKVCRCRCRDGGGWGWLAVHDVAGHLIFLFFLL